MNQFILLAVYLLNVSYAAITTTTRTTTTTTTVAASSQPVISKWKQTTGVGYKNYTADVKNVYYDSSYVYVSTNSIPSYSIGPWSSNPNTPTPQNLTYKFYRTPSNSSTSKTAMKLGPIGKKQRFSKY